MPTYPVSTIIPTIRYYPNPSIWQPNQAVTITPFPGSSAISYAVTGGSLPSGLTINATTGVISGTVVSNTPQTILTIGGTQPDSSIVYCTVILTIESIPAIAPLSNQASATSMTDLQAYAAQNFITAATLMIGNNTQLGLFHVYMDMLPHLPFRSLQTYFQSLGYNFFPVNVSAYNGYPVSFEPFTVEQGAFYYGYPYSLLNYGNILNYSTPYGSPQSFAPPPRILITWQSTPQYPQWPYYPWP